MWNSIFVVGKKYPFSVFGVWVVGLSEGQVHNLGWQNT